MSSSETIELKGMDETIERMKEMIKKYPDASITGMEKVGRKFKSNLRKNVKSSLHGKTKDGYKRLVSGFRTTVNGYGLTTEVEFSAEGRKNHDWHLVESGHNIVEQMHEYKVKLKGHYVTLGHNPGKHKGFVPGIKQMDVTVDGFEDDMKKCLDKTMDDLVRRFEK